MEQLYKDFYNISLYSVNISASIQRVQQAQMDKQVANSENREIQGQHALLKEIEL